MNKTAIKNFAVWARNKLIADISYRAGLMGITESGIASALPQSTGTTEFYDIGTAEPYAISGDAVRQRRRLVELIERKAKETDYKTAYKYIIEEVAYTWFNRLIAIRFMEVNDYLPSHIRVLSSESGKMEPDIVTSPFEADLVFSSEEEKNIIKLKQSNELDELFRFLFIKQCNSLSHLLPELFEINKDFTELLLNISFVDQEGLVAHLIKDIPEEDFDIRRGGQVEIIGWLYQHYNTEPKDEAFALLKKNVKISKETIPAATQLFTPDWIVRYMVENSLGRFWKDTHKSSALHNSWEFYVEEEQQTPDVVQQLENIKDNCLDISPEKIKIIDPCMGSGHILVYCFDILMQIYETQGYSQRDAAKLIIENNLYGLDIDNRAAQLAYFAVMMKAREYDRRIFNREIKHNIFSIEESNGINRRHLQFIGDVLDSKLQKRVHEQWLLLLDSFVDAKELGSMLIIPDLDWDLLYQSIDNSEEAGQINFETIGINDTKKELVHLLGVAKCLTNKYHIVVTNPPYMSNRNMGKKLAAYIQKHYKDSKNDTFAVFIDVASRLVENNGFYAMITQPSIISLSAFKKLRYGMIKEQNIVSLIHMGRGIFGIDFGSAAFVMRKCALKKYKSSFFKLYNRTFQYIAPEDICKIFLSTLKDHNYTFNFSTYNTSEEGVGEIGQEEEEVLNENSKIFYSLHSEDFLEIPDNPFAYWMAPSLIDAFSSTKVSDYASVTNGLFTCDNNRFLRLWYEVDVNNIFWKCRNKEENLKDNRLWYPYNKGGNYRKWYGNHEYVVRFENFGKEISEYRVASGQSASFPGQDYYFKESLSWSFISAAKFGIRYYPEGFIFDIAGSSVFVNESEDLYNILAFLGSEVAVYALQIMNPTMNYQAGNVRQLPISKKIVENKELGKLAKRNIELAKEDWDDFEISWEFSKHPLINGERNLKEAYEKWEDITKIRFEEVKANEQKINEIVVSEYKLDDHIMNCPEEKYITMRKADLIRDVKSLLSYAVGCMYGRYSLDESGIICAGGEFDLKRYSLFTPDVDAIIPITDEEYLEDDIVSRLCDWLKMVYGSETLEDNLDFIAKALGNKGKSAREVIRNYFLNDFEKDHIKIYQKRPIYWLYDSGKQNGFKALVYMHRYNANTIGDLRIDYLHRMQRVYESEINRMQDTIDHSANAREVAAATKRKEKLQKQLKECREYDEKIGHLALSRIDIDLDDGVKVNYEKVQTASDGKKYQVLAKI